MILRGQTHSTEDAEEEDGKSEAESEGRAQGAAQQENIDWDAQDPGFHSQHNQGEKGIRGVRIYVI